MAKSLRSKWKRKCRAIKRERYGAKELERLKKTLGVDENGAKDIEMNEITKIATGRAHYFLICHYSCTTVPTRYYFCLKLLMLKR